VNLDAAATLAQLIHDETGLVATVWTDGNDVCVDVELPLIGDELRARVIVNEVDDWPWHFEAHVRHRLTKD